MAGAGEADFLRNDTGLTPPNEITSYDVDEKIEVFLTYIE